MTSPGADRADRVGYLLPTEGEARVRRARNAVGAGVGALLLLATVAASTGPGSLQGAVDEAIGRLPGWWEVVFWVSFGAAGLFGMAVLVALLARFRRNPAAVRDVVLALVVAVTAATLLMLWKVGDGPALLPELGAADPRRQFPVLRVVAVTTIVLTAAPHLATVVRRLGMAMVALVALSSLGLGFGFPSDAIAAIGLGMLASGVVLLVFGSPGGFPPTHVVAGALLELGVDVHDLRLTDDESWGIRRFLGRDAEGRVVEVKAYGKDAVDTQVAATLWRALWYRGTVEGTAFTRMQSVEHEALVTLYAARAGVRTVDLVAAGRAGDDVAILAVRRPGDPLASRPEDEVSDPLLVDLWRDVDRLHAAGVAHGTLRTSSITVDDHGHVLGDFTEGSLGARESRRLDVANLLFSLATMVGVERAVTTARAGLGDEALAASLPYLQLPALRREVRGSVDAPKDLVAALRDAAAEATGAEPPEPVRLRRVTLGQLLMLALVLFAASALLSQLADVDFAAVWEIVRDASWPVLVLALPVAQLVFGAEASAMMAAVGQPLPRRPLVVLQVATRFIGLAVPSAAGRVAMNSAFLVRFGLTPAVAVVQGAIDGMFGFLVEAAVLGAALLLSDASLSLAGDRDWGLILAVVLVIALIGAVVALRVRRVRDLVLPVLLDALGSARSVLADPDRALRLVGNNLLSRTILAVTLWLILRAIGVDDVSIPIALAVTVATNLLAGITPVPGGIGVAEAVMTSWLVIVGVPEEQAFAATVMYRLWTFYVPAVEGVVATRWLERNDYL